LVVDASTRIAQARIAVRPGGRFEKVRLSIPMTNRLAPLEGIIYSVD
jgi:hypothetical protein